MLPLTIDRRVLSLLPPMDAALEGRVLTVLRAIAERRVLPHFAARGDIDALQLARASERHRITRFEDASGELELVSFVAKTDGKWSICLHERFFDYIAFGLPANPLQAFHPTTEEAAKVMALAEFVLRHEFEHIVHQGQPETKVLASDCRFVRDRRDAEPTFHEHLMAGFADPTNGLRTDTYEDLIARFEQGDGFEAAASDAVAAHVGKLCELPSELLSGAFMTMARPDKEQLLAACYRLVTDHRLTVTKRARHLESMIALLDRQRRDDEGELRLLFDSLLAFAPRDLLLRDLELATDELETDDDAAV